MLFRRTLAILCEFDEGVKFLLEEATVSKSEAAPNYGLLRMTMMTKMMMVST